VLSQADQARQFGARVYCVGVKDFDANQVRLFNREMKPAVEYKFFLKKTTQY